MYRTLIKWVIFLLVATPIFAAEFSGINVAHGKYNDYYHMIFTLTPQNCELAVPSSERKNKYGESNQFSFSEGGQFEVFIRKTVFPIPAPHTESEFLILRMPWTDPSSGDAERNILVKRRLFERIRNMKTEGKGRIEVTIELNPYITVLNKNPLKIELSGRVIFFRQVHGQYIDHVGLLNPKDDTETFAVVNSQGLKKGQICSWLLLFTRVNIRPAPSPRVNPVKLNLYALHSF